MGLGCGWWRVGWLGDGDGIGSGLVKRSQQVRKAVGEMGGGSIMRWVWRLRCEDSVVRILDHRSRSAKVRFARICNGGIWIL